MYKLQIMYGGSHGRINSDSEIAAIVNIGEYLKTDKLYG
jgi:hypothetical protein